MVASVFPGWVRNNTIPSFHLLNASIIGSMAVCADLKLKSFTKEITFKVDVKGASISYLNLLRIYKSKPSYKVITFFAEV